MIAELFFNTLAYRAVLIALFLASVVGVIVYCFNPPKP